MFSLQLAISSEPEKQTVWSKEKYDLTLCQQFLHE